MNSKMRDGGAARRDAARSRRAILDAAERLFAAHDFESVTMERIGRAAGLSRGAPGYFFGSKEALHRAVLERMVERTEQLVDHVTRRSAALPRGDLQAALEMVVDELLDFLFERPAYLVLVERQVLRQEGVMHGSRIHLSLLRAVQSAIGDGRAAGLSAAEVNQLLLSVLSLCWFPLAHSPLIRDLGEEPDREFVESRKRHVTALLRGALAAAPPRR
ncbi:MAG TPA: TetR/AcrR family transcriptional regulator [Candidatus Dormibacteraeota bacterium]|nr:TetR/AcrR family transcriptional regulator [Candidatus Dormibacteraeota bacterium]